MRARDSESRICFAFDYFELVNFFCSLSALPLLLDELVHGIKQRYVYCIAYHMQVHNQFIYVD